MNNRTRIIFCIVLFLVGLQWVVPDPSDTILTGSSLTIAWNDLDDDDVDDDNLDDHTPLTDLAFFPHDMSMAGPAIIEWLLPSSDSDNLRRLAVSHRIPRAPPASTIQIAVYPHSIFSVWSSALSAITPTRQSQPSQFQKELPTVSTDLLFPIAINPDSLTQIFHGKEAILTPAGVVRMTPDGLYGMAVPTCSTI